MAMAIVKITDDVNAAVDIQLRDDSLLAKFKLSELTSTSANLLQDFRKPIDQAEVVVVALGATFASPNLVNEDLGALSISAGINSGFCIKTAKDKLLFGDDGFSPTIPISANEAWLGVDFDISTTVSGSASTNGVGVSLNADGKVKCSTYTLFPVTAPPLPLLGDSIGTAFGNFSLATSASAIRKQPVGTVNAIEVSGSITVCASFDQPFTLNPLASASLPLNLNAAVQPSVTLEIGSSLELTGDLIVRCHKVSESAVRMGVYKMHGSTVSVSMTAGAGIEGKIGGDDVLSALLNKALPGVDVAAAGINGENATALNDIIRDGMNRSLSAQFNATCSAAFTDEAALLYEIQLDGGDTVATDNALGLALRGRWSALEGLPNAKRLRNIAVETVERKRSLSLNLLGFYSATSTEDYLKSCTILVDEMGHVTITEKIDASRISASTSPSAADSSKLRRALMEDFLCTATYAALGGKLSLNLSVTQSYSQYSRNMSPADARESVLLGYSLGLIPSGSLDSVLAITPAFYHAFVSVNVQYDMPALMRVFYNDPTLKTPRSHAELEQAGRAAMAALLDASDPTNTVRLSVLGNADTWSQMDGIGNVAAFHTIPSLSSLGATQLGVVGADWVTIAWWADAMSKIAPALAAAMSALNAASVGDPTQDPDFMKSRAKLSSVLGGVTRNTSAPFAHGWGTAVMFALSGMHGAASMDLNWNSKNLYFGPPV
jgi:hypothetical protein